LLSRKNFLLRKIKIEKFSLHFILNKIKIIYLLFFFDVNCGMEMDQLVIDKTSILLKRIPEESIIIFFFTDYSPLQIQQFYSWFFKLKQIRLMTCILVIICLMYSPLQFQQLCSWLFKLMQIGSLYINTELCQTISMWAKIMAIKNRDAPATLLTWH